MPMQINDENVKISVAIRNKGMLLANANVSIETVVYGWITIKGFQIWVSRNFNERLQEKINIAPPTAMCYGHYIPKVFFDDPKKWYGLEERVYGAYVMARNQFDEKLKAAQQEKVNPDDVPM